MNVGQAIKVIRKKSNLNQGTFANAIGFTQTYLSQIESGKKTPSIDVLDKISKLTGTPVPAIMILGLERGEVPEHKRELFDQLKPFIDDMIKELVPSLK